LDQVLDWLKSGEDPVLIAGEVNRERRLIKPAPNTHAPAVIVSPTVASNRLSVVATNAPPAAPMRHTYLVFGGITWLGSRGVATINGRSFTLNDEWCVSLHGTNAMMHCVEIREGGVVVTMGQSAERVELSSARPPEAAVQSPFSTSTNWRRRP
jgi:hypothetical protein